MKKRIEIYNLNDLLFFVEHETNFEILIKVVEKSLKIFYCRNNETIEQAKDEIKTMIKKFWIDAPEHEKPIFMNVELNVIE